MERKEHSCICCGTATDTVHDYREQVIKDIPAFGKLVSIVLRKRRYRCKCCGKRFFECNSFLPKYHRMTNRLSAFIIEKLRDGRSFTSVAREVNLSVSTVIRIFDTVSYPKAELSQALSIDEFKGNAASEKYQCILVDPVKHRVLDILPDRKRANLADYFYSIPKAERYRVKFFSCDMWEQYVDLARIYFPNATIVIDKYHFIRQVSWAIERVRKRLQKTMPANLRKYYKRSRSLILKRYSKLKDEEKQACDLMLLYNDDLRLAHYLKERFFEICQNTKYSEQRTDFFDWIKMAENSGLKEFEDCAKTYRHWSKEILHAFKYKFISNGPTEGFNNKIKVLKRTSYGVRNFERFRTRILLATN